jgi:tetratricopeptide (TPR) repeat protein
VDQAAISLSYLSSLFWGLDTSFHTYQPVWGGYLNPVLGSLFLIGLLKACKNFQSVLNRWLLAGGILFILPGVLTSDRETFRMVPLIPILFMVTSLGLGQLLVSSSVRKNAWIVSLVFLFSTGLDYHHLEKYHRLWDSMDNWKGYAKSWERYKAYGILEQINREEGPGLIFSDLTPGLCDQTLNVADDGFNALENRLLHPNQARWVAVLVNVNEKPFLEKRFSGSRSYALSREDRPPDGGLMLWTVPLSESNRPAFLPWVRFQQALKPFIDESLGYIQGQSYSRSLDLLAEALPMMEGDPFLLSRYWNLRADLLVKAGDLAESEISLQNVVKQGDPSADLYYRLGVLQWLQGKKGLASKSFDSAVHAPLNLTASTQWLESHP